MQAAVQFRMWYADQAEVRLANLKRQVHLMSWAARKLMRFAARRVAARKAKEAALLASPYMWFLDQVCYMGLYYIHIYYNGYYDIM